jgi:hypothetical protein
MNAPSVLQQMLRRASPKLHERGRVLKAFTRQLGFVYFGTVDQHHDEHSAVRGFTASLSHSDSHYAVGTYNGYDIRLLDRFDVVRSPSGAHTARRGLGKTSKQGTYHTHQQLWTIIEIKLTTAQGLPHLFFVPTSKEAGEYSQLYATYTQLQPLNSFLSSTNRSPEFHGRYQILARPTHSHQVEHLFESPTIVAMGARFWPHGIELHHDTLYVYITEPRLSRVVLETALSSALWLAETIDAQTK